MTRAERRRRVAAVLLGAVGPMAAAIASIVVLAWMAGGGPPTTETGRSSSSQTPEPTSKAPSQEVSRLHQALHGLASECQKEEPARSVPRIDRSVDIVLSFARRYPEGRFAIDDETGNRLSLLLATHDDLRTCAPAAAARLNQALPPEFRGR